MPLHTHLRAISQRPLNAVTFITEVSHHHPLAYYWYVKVVNFCIQSITLNVSRISSILSPFWHKLIDICDWWAFDCYFLFLILSLPFIFLFQIRPYWFCIFKKVESCFDVFCNVWVSPLLILLLILFLIFDLYFCIFFCCLHHNTVM